MGKVLIGFGIIVAAMAFVPPFSLMGLLGGLVCIGWGFEMMRKQS